MEENVKTVYLVIHNIPYEARNVVMVFEDREIAEEFAKEENDRKHEWDTSGYEVEEWEVK